MTVLFFNRTEVKIMFKTEQENLWAGAFGSEYFQRNQGAALLASNLNFFAKALRAFRGVKNCLELVPILA